LEESVGDGHVADDLRLAATAQTDIELCESSDPFEGMAPGLRDQKIGLCARIRKAGEMAATLRMALDLEVA
jgi:hypothetical protein